MIKNWFDVDYSAYSHDAVNMVINGVLEIPDEIAAWNAIQCEGTCTCPDENGNIPVVTDCANAVNKYA